MVTFRSTLLLLGSLSFLTLAGCTICTDCEDQAYPTYGGIWQRTDRFHGRVGSLFEPAGVKVAQPGDLRSAPASDEGIGDEGEYETLPPGDMQRENGTSPDEANPDDSLPSDGAATGRQEVQLQQPAGDEAYFGDLGV